MNADLLAQRLRGPTRLVGKMIDPDWIRREAQMIVKRSKAEAKVHREVARYLQE